MEYYVSIVFFTESRDGSDNEDEKSPPREKDSEDESDTPKENDDASSVSSDSSDSSKDSANPDVEPKDTETTTASGPPPSTSQANKFLGENPEESKVPKLEIHDDLIPRINEWIKSGLSKEFKDSILKTTPRVGEKINLDPPVLNEEILHGLNDFARKRDEHFCEAYRVAAAALASIALAMTHHFNDSKKDKVSHPDNERVIQLHANTLMMLTDLLHSNVVARKAFITPAYDKKFREILEKSVTDRLLFGDKLGERFKEWQSLGKTESEMKGHKKSAFKPFNMSSGNWRRPSKQEAGTVSRKRNYNASASRKDKSYNRPARSYTQTQPLSHGGKHRPYRGSQESRRY